MHIINKSWTKRKNVSNTYSQYVFSLSVIMTDTQMQKWYPVSSHKTNGVSICVDNVLPQMCNAFKWPKHNKKFWEDLIRLLYQHVIYLKNFNLI
jgi:hypothetical protein